MGIKHLLMQWPPKISGLDFGDSPLPRNQRDKIATRSTDFSPIPAKQDLLDPIVEPNICGRELNVGKKSNVCKRLIETSAESRNDNNLLRFYFYRTVDGELQISFIL